jgi:hypothetical protein
MIGIVAPNAMITVRKEVRLEPMVTGERESIQQHKCILDMNIV